jgi:Ca2+-binding RTX toxin-like protein
MVKTVKFGSLDALVGLSFDSGSLAYSAPTKINGTVTNTTASSTEVLTYYGLSATVGSPFITLPNISFKVVSVSDATNELTIDAYYGSSMVAELGFTVTGFSAAGLALSSIPIDAMVLTGTNLPSLMGSAFVLGYNIAQAASQSIQFKESDLYSFALGQSRVRDSQGRYDHRDDRTADLARHGRKRPDRRGQRGGHAVWRQWRRRPHCRSGQRHALWGAGNDLLYGSTGTSVLKGGAGNDTLRAWTGHGNDRGRRCRHLRLRARQYRRLQPLDSRRHQRFLAYGGRPHQSVSI